MFGLLGYSLVLLVKRESGEKRENSKKFGCVSTCKRGDGTARPLQRCILEMVAEQSSRERAMGFSFSTTMTRPL